MAGKAGRGAIRKGNWKLFNGPPCRAKPNSTNCLMTRAKKENVADKHPEIVRELEARLLNQILVILREHATEESRPFAALRVTRTVDLMVERTVGRESKAHPAFKLGAGAAIFLFMAATWIFIDFHYWSSVQRTVITSAPPDAGRSACDPFSALPSMGLFWRTL